MGLLALQRNLKAQICFFYQNPKKEIRNNLEIQNPNFQNKNAYK